jgi:hypothetical protein
VDLVIVLSLRYSRRFFLDFAGVRAKHTPNATDRLVRPFALEQRAEPEGGKRRLATTTKPLKELATPAGFEPAAFSLEGREETVADQSELRLFPCSKVLLGHKLTLDGSRHSRLDIRAGHVRFWRKSGHHDLIWSRQLLALSGRSMPAGVMPLSIMPEPLAMDRAQGF